ncbi:MAG: phage integrase N-terminal SAM-like domain-containing protein [Minicystis sp.]
MTLIEATKSTFRRLHYSPRTEEAYLRWIREFIRFHRNRHPRDLGPPEITAFLNHLAVERRTSASTQNQALCAIVFLYKRVLGLEIPALEGVERARRPEHLPAVLSRPEVIVLLDKLVPPFRLIGELLHGSGLRLLECLSLRIEDLDLDRRQILIRRGKGQVDRAALLAGRGDVDLPHALRVKMPSAARSLAWQVLFPASRPCTDPATGRPGLYHLHESARQKAVLRAAREARTSSPRNPCPPRASSFARNPWPHPAMQRVPPPRCQPPASAAPPSAPQTTRSRAPQSSRRCSRRASAPLGTQARLYERERASWKAGANLGTRARLLERERASWNAGANLGTLGSWCFSLTRSGWF